MNIIEVIAYEDFLEELEREQHVISVALALCFMDIEARRNV